MARRFSNPADAALRRIRWPLRATRAGMLAERAARAFWPFWSVAMAGAAALLFGLHRIVPLEAAWTAAALLVAGAAAALVHGLLRFRVPAREEALDRLDRAMDGRPVAALGDRQAVGAGDGASEAVWREHVARMAERASGARPVAPDLRLSDRDRFALRYAALLAIVMAVLFGSERNPFSAAGTVPAQAGAPVAGPSWEGWIEPPAYTGKPSLYLNDIAPGGIRVPESSLATIRFYGEAGALAVDETVSGRVGELPPATQEAQGFQVAMSGRLAIVGPGGAEWRIDAIPDLPPVIEAVGEPTRNLAGMMLQDFAASDDYGVVGGRAEISLDLAAVDRRHGLAAEPEPREAIVLDLPVSFTGDRAAFEETVAENLSKHPWATLPVKLELVAVDAAGQEGRAEPVFVELPRRRFFDPLARAVAEQRRDLLWNRANAPRVAGILRAVSHRADDVFDSAAAYLKLRFALRRMEAQAGRGIADAELEELAEVLWDVAVLIEDGDVADSRRRLQAARERLREAIRDGATEEEIAELMREFREALRDYMRDLARMEPEDDADRRGQDGETLALSQDQLQEMMDRIQELLAQGRMEEAQALLDQLMEIMENTRVARGRAGDGANPLDGLQETLRRQQGLSDETFGDLQQRYGERGGQQGQQGRLPGQGQGEGQGGGGDFFGQGQGRGGNGPPRFGQGGRGERDGLSLDSLAERQGALRRELDRQRGRGDLPGAGTPEGDAAREALDLAEQAMGDAEEALRGNDLARALDSQSEAIERLREGLRDLAEAMGNRQASGGQRGGQGPPGGSAENPLGQEQDGPARGQARPRRGFGGGEFVYERARELLDEIRRRSAERERPQRELDYLRRLLDRF